MVVVGCQMLFQLLCGSSYYHSADWSSPTVELEEQVSEVGREVAADQPAPDRNLEKNRDNLCEFLNKSPKAVGPSGRGAARPCARQLFYRQPAAGRPPFGQPHTRQFHFAPARTRPPPAPSGWPSNQGRAVVSGTRRIGRCRLCGGARAGFGGGGVGGRRLPNLRRGRVWSI